MKMNNMNKSFTKQLLLSVSFLFALNIVNAQTAPTPKSPAATATGTIKSGANITIKYSSPSVRDRKIWGGLVPFDSIWRAGANNATQIEVDKDVKIAGKVLTAGKYTIYMIPTEKKCTVIFSSQTGQPGMNHDGSTTFDKTKEVLRGQAAAKKSKEFKESLLYTVTGKGIVLSWENLDIILSIK
ncbi:MAG: DUF2911 domain-containing protein [Bacteroidetes bacterium]|nr:DUF2911 domain-containing protein [Bacteroidota bacterium]